MFIIKSTWIVYNKPNLWISYFGLWTWGQIISCIHENTSNLFWMIIGKVLWTVCLFWTNWGLEIWKTDHICPVKVENRHSHTGGFDSNQTGRITEHTLTSAAGIRSGKFWTSSKNVEAVIRNCRWTDTVLTTYNTILQGEVYAVYGNRRFPIHYHNHYLHDIVVKDIY